MISRVFLLAADHPNNSVITIAHSDVHVQAFELESPLKTLIDILRNFYMGFCIVMYFSNYWES